MSALLAELYARATRGIDLSLDRMRVACAAEGHPEHAGKAIHVAGTNGKGSTCAMLASALAEFHIRAGLYTSPHLARFAERIRVDGMPIDDALLARSLRGALAHADLTFFEVATLTSFLAFREAKVDACVLEVGLGGRLDATNVIESPTVTVITRIAFDHEDMLGNTLAQIATEKAGIAKTGVPLVIGALEPEAEQAVYRVAHERGATVIRAMDDDAARAFVATTKLALAGAHQHDNARVAFVAGRLAGIDAGPLAAGIAKAVWPARLEVISARGVTFVLDAAHNPDGARALVHALATHGVPALGEQRPHALVFGALADKRWRDMLDTIAPEFAPENRVYTIPQGRAAAPPQELAALQAGAAVSSLEEALDRACEAAHAADPEAPVVLVCGSIYLVGAARALLLGERRDPPVAL